MIVAMVTMWMVQMPVNQIVYVIAMRDSLVAASGAVDMIGVVAVTTMVGSAAIGILVRNGDCVFFDHAPRRRMMQMSVMQVVDVSIVLDRRVTATGAVFMIVVLMVVGHCFISPFVFQKLSVPSHVRIRC
jgi:hypothetical protein